MEISHLGTTFITAIQLPLVRQLAETLKFQLTQSGNKILPKPFAVRVLRLADETEQDMPYKSYLYIKDDIDDVTRQQKFELLGEVDKDGNLIPGNPNLAPEHQTKVPQVQKVAEPVANARETEAVQAEPAPAPKRRERPAQVTLQETQA